MTDNKETINPDIERGKFALTAASVLRFAPSPNGELHPGHALSALINYDAAQHAGAKFLLRIEDIDPGRRREAFVDGIMHDLDWLGISWPQPVLMQSTRFDAYKEAASKLGGLGLSYPCFATRAEVLAAADPDNRDPDGAPLYPGLHKNLTAAEIRERRAAGQPFAMRLDMARAVELAEQRLRGDALTFREVDAEGAVRSIVAQPERWGDAILQRKDTPTSYHLAVVVDDTFQDITHVIRGVDLRSATDIHRLLQVLLDLPAPIYHHHRLITGDDGLKLAKSRGDQSLRALRESGCSAQDVRNMVGLG